MANTAIRDQLWNHSGTLFHSLSHLVFTEHLWQTPWPYKQASRKSFWSSEEHLTWETWESVVNSWLSGPSRICGEPQALWPSPPKNCPIKEKVISSLGNWCPLLVPVDTHFSSLGRLKFQTNFPQCRQPGEAALVLTEQPWGERLILPRWLVVQDLAKRTNSSALALSLMQALLSLENNTGLIMVGQPWPRMLSSHAMKGKKRQGLNCPVKGHPSSLLHRANMFESSSEISMKKPLWRHSNVILENDLNPFISSIWPGKPSLRWIFRELWLRLLKFCELL